MRVVTAAEIDGALTFPTLVDALAEAFRGDVVVPVRHHHEIEREPAAATLLLMPAWTGRRHRGGPCRRQGRVGVPGERRPRAAERARAPTC